MPRRAAHPNGTLLFVCLPCLAVLLAFNAYAQPKPAPAAGSAVSRPSTTPKPGAGPAWSELEPSEQIALRPLQNDWASIDELGKRKWRRIAERYPEMSATDQERLQNRMTEWAKLTPQERGKVRLQYLEAKKVPASSRQADWEAYQALSPDERKALAARGANAPRATGKSVEATAHSVSARRNAPRAAKADTASAAASAPTAKPAKPATPTVVQAAPGATTVLITKQQTSQAQPATGNAKIAVSPDVVDRSTLLPQTGPQSSRARTTAASTPATRP